MIKKITKNHGNKYYQDSSNKFIDFLIGFFGVGIVWTILSTLITLLFSFGYYGSELYIYASAIIFLIISIFLIIYFQNQNRKWISIGILLALITPIILFLLLAGACLIMI